MIRLENGLVALLVQDPTRTSMQMKTCNIETSCDTEEETMPCDVSIPKTSDEECLEPAAVGNGGDVDVYNGSNVEDNEDGSEEEMAEEEGRMDVEEESEEYPDYFDADNARVSIFIANKFND